MAPIPGRTAFADLTNVAQDSPKKSVDSQSYMAQVEYDNAMQSPKRTAALTKQLIAARASSKVANTIQNHANTKLSESFQDVLDEQAASDDVLSDMLSVENNILLAASLAAGEVRDVDERSMPVGASSRNAAVWILAHLVEHVQLPEARWLDALLLLDVYCIHRPDALESPSLAALCAAVARLVKKFEDAGGHTVVEVMSTLHSKATCLAQWMQKSGYPHSGQMNTVVTPADLNLHENEILCALRWTIKLPTTQDWMTVFCARLNVFTCSGLKHLLTPMWQYNFQLAHMLATHCPTTETCGAHRVAQGLLCLSLVAAQVLPADAFCLTELAVPLPPAGTARREQQCKQESLEFLFDGLQAATGSDLSTLKVDTHLVNETLLALKSIIDPMEDCSR